MTTFSPQSLATESYSLLISPKTGYLKEIKAAQTKIRIEEEGILNTVSMYRATLVPSAKFAKRQLVYMAV